MEIKEKKNFRPRESISRFTNAFISKRSVQRRSGMIKIEKDEMHAREDNYIMRSQLDSRKERLRTTFFLSFFLLLTMK